MYAVSNAYKQTLLAEVHQYRLRGTIGSVAFTEENLLYNSLSIANQCSEGDEIKIGSVYAGELRATFVDVNIPRSNWRGKQITVSEDLKISADSWESVPLGIFTIASAKHTLEGVEVVAYDNMTLLDKHANFDQTSGTPYDILLFACESCGVTLANTQAQIEAMPNGGALLKMNDENDIDTWRDLVSWLVQTLAAFATINRAGELEIRQYSTTSVASIDETQRFTGCSFSDYTVKYTGCSVVLTEAQMTRYVHADPDDGLTYNMGANPFLQDDASFDFQQALIEDFSTVQLVPFSAQMLGGAIYDLGDCLTFAGGIAQGAVCGLMSYSYSYGGAYSIEGYGSNPDLANAKSKTDKALQGLMSQEDPVHFFDYVNSIELAIGDGEELEIFNLQYFAPANSHGDFHAEIKGYIETTEEEIEDGYINNDCVITATYFWDDEEMIYHPQVTHRDGVTLLHLVYPFKTAAERSGVIRVVLSCEGGSFTIAPGDMIAYLQGYRMIATWDGEAEDTIPPIQIITGAYSEEAYGSIQL